MIKLKALLTEIQHITKKDPAPVYILEIPGDDDVLLGRAKLHVKGKRQKDMLEDNKYFDITITPSKEQP